MTIVKMKQTSRYRWQIESQTGHILQKDLAFTTYAEAERYIENYVTSFIDWGYEMVAL